MFLNVSQHEFFGQPPTGCGFKQRGRIELVLLDQHADGGAEIFGSHRRGCRGSCRRRCRGRLPGRCDGGGTGGFHLRDGFADVDGIARFARQANHTRRGGIQVDVGLVRFQQTDRFIFRDSIAIFFEPLKEDGGGYGFTETGNFDGSGHETLPEG